MKSENSSSEMREWRIKPIHFCDPLARMETNWGALFGAFLFIGGIFAGLKINALFALSVIGLIIGLISILFRAKITRRNWKKVLAQCIDREYKSVLGRPGPKGGTSKTWTFMLLCEFEMNGKRYTVTPDYWTTFFSEARVQNFLGRVISPNSTCELWVNPKNPLQTELIAHDIKDLLLHN